MDVETARSQPILELRVHGVSNTPPEGMLDLDPDEVERADGDGLGSFWAPTAEAEARGRAAAPGTLRHIPPGVRREAYSWGAMARIGGVPGGRVLGAVARVAVRAAWALLTPLGLANVAYWARPVHDPRRPGAAGPEPTAAATRVFALLLTLLLTAAVTTAAIDTLGTQCMRQARRLAGAVVVDVCARVPEQLYWLARWDHGPRTGLLSAVPVVVIVALVLVAQSARVRFDGRVSTVRGGAVPGARPGQSGLLLHRPGFWVRKDAGADLLLVHLGAAVALVALLVSWTARPGATQRVVAACAAVVLGVAVVLVALRTDDNGVEVGHPVPAGGHPEDPPTGPPTRHGGVRSVLAAGVAGLGVAAWVAAWVAAADRAGVVPDHVGVDAAPSVLGTALAAIATSGLVWRYGAWARVWWAVPVVATAAVGAVVLGAPDAWTTPLVVTAIVALAVPAAAALVAWVQNLRPHEGWDGAGPGVFLLLSAAGAAVLSALVVLGVQWWLRGSSARQLALDPVEPGLTVPVLRRIDAPVTVDVPPAYTEFGAWSVVILLVFVVMGVMVLGPALYEWARRACRWVPVAPRTCGDLDGPSGWAFREIRDGEFEETDGRRHHRDGHQPVDSDMSVVVRRVQRARRLAALLHRAEAAVGGLAVASWVALAAAIAWRVPGEPDAAGFFVLPQWSLGITVPVLGAVAAGIVGGAVAGGAGNLARPFGILWDLMGFLPRSAHPFGPPSYAERAVPELRARVDGWLSGADLPAYDDATRARRRTVARDRRVVLSAHSLGAVIAAAVLLIRHGNPVDDRDARLPGRVGLLTYGVQLRPYFSRFFPELLGPRVLGVPWCGRPAWRGDPWRWEQPPARAALANPAGTSPEPTSLHEILREGSDGRRKVPAWVNLWRRTDFLGFPAVGYGWNPVDRGAEEVDRGSYLFAVASHSAYPRTLAYQRALQEVVDRLDDREWLDSYPTLCETAAWWRPAPAADAGTPLAEAQPWRPVVAGSPGGY
ncbi:hypothetical protein [Isoptericola variabilis]|uniref:Integral membrane protein n=1 Tax=Isoptericola variabilis (strain 225) TaxID=743718 RepID=F6FUE4_ISOV2|nr:hypothetical protein [Isoptericola variabilis]AEG44272.1 hypothetical protein Isova_1512 [Isoptericola variabilis 225]TWH28406.1 hypothetical protein L600_000400000050 [Isoptericola variabilis J7]